jgi:outer membrane protein OmpA-like peptidoglycan-associated protein
MTASEYARRTDGAGGAGSGAAQTHSFVRYALAALLLLVGVADLAAIDLVLLPRYLAGATSAFSPSPPNPLATATRMAEAPAPSPPVVTAVPSIAPPPASPPAAAPISEAPALPPPPSPPAVAAHARPELDEAPPGEPSAATTAPADLPEPKLPDLFFARNTSWLSPAARESLGRLAATLAADPSRRVVLGGHTDNVGAEDHNRALSTERARRCANWLEGQGIDPGRIEIHGFGSTRPAAGDDSPQAQARNRRVEIDLR